MDFQLSGWNFSKFIEEEVSPFEKLFNIFKELIVYTSGDFDEAIEWLRELDKEYKLTDENYTIDNFVNDLLSKGYVTQEINPSGSIELLKKAFNPIIIDKELPYVSHNDFVQLRLDGWLVNPVIRAPLENSNITIVGIDILADGKKSL